MSPQRQEEHDDSVYRNALRVQAETLAALVDKWRRLRDAAEGEQDRYQIGVADARDRCADELEAATLRAS